MRLSSRLDLALFSTRIQYALLSLQFLCVFNCAVVSNGGSHEIPAAHEHNGTNLTVSESRAWHLAHRKVVSCKSFASSGAFGGTRHLAFTIKPSKSQCINNIAISDASFIRMSDNNPHTDGTGSTKTIYEILKSKQRDFDGIQALTCLSRERKVGKARRHRTSRLHLHTPHCCIRTNFPIHPFILVLLAHPRLDRKFPLREGRGHVMLHAEHKRPRRPLMKSIKGRMFPRYPIHISILPYTISILPYNNVMDVGLPHVADVEVHRLHFKVGADAGRPIDG